jgi:hypothetical protein
VQLAARVKKATRDRKDCKDNQAYKAQRALAAT